ncbi:HIT family protein [Candidatus Woesearchaeota archaeon]|nr:MAG: HIT family protein [Candidatus Woesearchaeota archaeon]
MGNDCIFCKIVKGELPCSKLYEDEMFLAFLDLYPVKKGHALVIPKEHYETIFDVPENVLEKYLSVIKKVAVAVKKGTDAKGINLAQANHKAANQAIPHIHFHVIPRDEGDGLGSWPQGKYEDREMDEFREKIAEHI